MIRDNCPHRCNPKRLYDYKELCRQLHLGLSEVCAKCIEECKSKDAVQLDLF